MPRPSVLVVDPESVRRKEISNGLTGFGYEVIPTVGLAEGRRFAATLGPGVVVVPAELMKNGDGAVSERFGGSEQTLLLLGKTAEEGRDLPEDVLFLEADGLPAEDLVRRIHLVLLGREIGVEPDSDVESLVGDFALLPFLELVRAVGRAHVTGRIVCANGEVTFDGGEVIAASAGRALGVKAFLRLSLLDAGPFWLWLRQPAGVEREIRQEIKALVFLALEDRVHDAPDPRTRARVQLGPAFFEARFNSPRCRAVGRSAGCSTPCPAPRTGRSCAT